MKEATPKISIIVPVYNVEQYLNRFFKSISNQNFKEFELLLIDDGSTDDSLKLCKEFESNDKRVKVYHQKNSGSGIARNYGLNEAKGKYIYFCDPDDYIQPDLLKDNYKIAESNDTNLVVFGYIEEDVKNNPKSYVIPKKGYYVSKEDFINAFPALLKQGLMYCVWNKLYLRRSIGKTRFTDIKVGQDVRFNIEYYKNISKVYCNDNYYYHYIINRPGSAQTKINLKKLFWRIDETNLFRTLFFETWKQKENVTYQVLIYSQYIQMCMRNILTIDQISDHKRKKVLINKIIMDKNVNKYLHINFRIGLKNNLKILFIKSCKFPVMMSLYTKLKQ